MKPIGIVRSPYREKFGVPRQAGLAPSVEAVIELDPARAPPESLRGLEGCSHLWIVFELHETGPSQNATVRPPRLGGNERLGVFATRSPFRPNPIGLSAVRLLAVEGNDLRVAGGDLIEGTPVLDLKPYVPYADSIPDARCEWAPAGPVSCAVTFSSAAESALAIHPNGEVLRRLIEESLRWDPRPAYREAVEGEVHGARFMDVNVRFERRGTNIHVDAVDGGPAEP